MENQCKKCKHSELDHYELAPYLHNHLKAMVGACIRQQCECGSFHNEIEAKSISSWKEVLIDEKTPNPAQVTERHFLRKQILKIISEFSPREQKILELRYGLKDGVTDTLEEVGELFGVTRDHIRAIEANALEKFRKHGLFKKIEEY